MEFKEGEKARVKGWHQLIDEFDVPDSDGDIPMHTSCFTSDKRQYCGDIITISEVRNGFYRIKEDNGLGYWTDDMLEPIDCPNTDTRRGKS